MGTTIDAEDAVARHPTRTADFSSHRSTDVDDHPRIEQR